MKCYFTILLAVLCAIGRSQDLNFPGMAPALSVSAVINKKLDANILAVSKIRLGNYTSKGMAYLQQVLEIYSQASVNYTINRHWQLSLGYGFQRNNPFNVNWRNEHRLVQQLILVLPLGDNKLLQRVRLEERWFTFPSGASSFGTRARYQLGYVIPLKGMMHYWQFNDEIFANTSGNANSLITENWLYSGVGYSLGSFGHLETGIGYNTAVSNNQHALSSLILLQIAWSYHLPSKSKKDMHPVMHARNF